MESAYKENDMRHPQNSEDDLKENLDSKVCFVLFSPLHGDFSKFLGRLGRAQQLQEKQA